MSGFRGFLFAGAVLLSALPAAAHEFQASSIRVDHPWARETPPGAPVAGGYVKIENKGAEPDRLLSVTSEIAAKVELHKSSEANGVASMRPLGAPLDLPPGQTVDFIAEGLHVMFVKPTRPLRKDDRFAATMVFEKAGPIPVEFVVQGMGTRAPAAEAGHGGHAASQ